MAWKVGVLTIGSLYWDDRPERVAWRQRRLDLARAVPVTAPIRYGRRSSRWGDTFTMVLSRQCDGLGCGMGTGMLVPCRRRVRAAENLLAEAVDLWRAEAYDPATMAVAAAKGCVALLPNPRRRLPAWLTAAWGEHFRAQPVCPDFAAAAAEPALVTESGLLDIDWPAEATSGRPADLDLILATPTLPTPAATGSDHPSAEDLARAWLGNTEGHERYFLRTRASGIATFQDDAIEQCMRAARPEWFEQGYRIGSGIGEEYVLPTRTRK